ncbi:hypothetical protein GLOIN_2v1790405 [Rhizophagus irregularis DAOM 181602=DAOM 197198]|nr:hypothetical protein GLOIN_2v1790405 [Rhizophagus irregularis DAOM 181602=DAOM 197198]
MQNTDGLGRQDDESFHAWAKRIQNAVQYYETCSRIGFHRRLPYPRSRQAVYAYIVHIRRIVSRLPNRWYCTYCKSFIDRGWGADAFMDQATRLSIDAKGRATLLLSCSIPSVNPEVHIYFSHSNEQVTEDLYFLQSTKNHVNIYEFASIVNSTDSTSEEVIYEASRIQPNVVSDETVPKIIRALKDTIVVALVSGFSKTSYLVQDHVKYIKRIQTANSPVSYVKFVARKLFPDNAAYTAKIAKIRESYKNKQALLDKLEASSNCIIMRLRTHQPVPKASYY